MRKIWILVCLIVLTATSVHAAPPAAEVFDAAPIFTDNMVLQAGKEIVIYGTSPEDGAYITVELGQENSTVQVKGGKWEARFPAREKGGEPFPIQILGSGEAEHIFIENVVMGEVWLVLGQSNVEYNATALPDWTEAAAHLPNNARVITYTSHDLTEETEGARSRMWRPLTQLSAAQASALGVLFTEGLAASTGYETPIGLISAGFRGQDLAAFLPPHLTEDMDAVDEKSRIYRKVIRNFEHFPMAGLIWYQGEANGVLYKQYAEKFSAFITEWREKAGHFPVYAVELCPCFTAPEGADTSARQYMDFGTVRGVIGTLPLYLSDVTICPTSDLFSDRAYDNSLHPPNKPAAANRVLAAVLAKTYGLAPERAVAPQITEISYGETKREVLLTYSAPLSVFGEALRGFSAIDKDWQPADIVSVRAEGNRVRLVTNCDVCIVRYGSHAESVFPETLTLMGEGGLPVPNLWYMLTEPDKPSVFSFALLYIVAFLARFWPLLLVPATGAFIWIWRKKHKKQMKKEKKS